MNFKTENSIIMSIMHLTLKISWIKVYECTFFYICDCTLAPSTKIQYIQHASLFLETVSVILCSRIKAGRLEAHSRLHYNPHDSFTQASNRFETMVHITTTLLAYRSYWSRKLLNPVQCAHKMYWFTDLDTVM